MAGTLLILGRSGQLAHALHAAAAGYDQVICAGRETADLEKPGAAADLIAALAPDAVINAAAFTAVDQAEADEAAAHRINAEAAGEAAEAARKTGARFVQVSTDYVFGGDGRTGPFDEDAQPAPVNAYGRTKLAGERRVLDVHPGAAVVRASAVFSGRGADFPSTMWTLAQTRDVVSVVEDQLTCPTFAGDLAGALLALSQEHDAAGIFHGAGAPFASWADFAAAALSLSAANGGPTARVQPITTRELPRPAPRPADSRLTGSRLEAVTGLAASDWRAALPLALDVWRSGR